MINHCKDYKTTEIKLIKQRHGEGVKIKDIAEELERSYEAIKSKCIKLGLRRYKKC